LEYRENEHKNEHQYYWMIERVSLLWRQYIALVPETVIGPALLKCSQPSPITPLHHCKALQVLSPVHFISFPHCVEFFIYLLTVFLCRVQKGRPGDSDEYSFLCDGLGLHSRLY